MAGSWQAQIRKPLAIDLFCGLGGWTEALLAEGWDVVGFDIERHRYQKIAERGAGAVKRPGMSWSNSADPDCQPKAFNSTDDVEFLPEMQEYPAQLVLQDVRLIHGAQFKDADLIVASPPCQEFSWRAMPWTLAKAAPPPYDGMNLFWQCWRIQHEASEAAGRYIPMIVENVKGAQKWVGSARWHYGSFYLWGDVPALMPQAKTIMKMGRAPKSENGSTRLLTNPSEWKPEDEYTTAHQQGTKNSGGSWFGIGSPGQKETGQNPVNQRSDGVKLRDEDGYERTHPNAFGWKSRRTSSKSNARKAASAQIAKIPYPLALHIARVFKP